MRIFPQKPLKGLSKLNKLELISERLFGLVRLVTTTMFKESNRLLYGYKQKARLKPFLRIIQIFNVNRVSAIIKGIK